MTPAEELRAAAKKVRETASKATPGPWTFTPDLYWDRGAITSTSPDVRGWDMLAMDVHSELEHANARWSALASPALAEPLAARLEEAARQCDLNEYRAPRHRFDPASDLAIARVLNGGPR